MTRRGNHEGSIYYREDRDQWVAVLPRGFELADGRRVARRREFTSRRSRTDAVRKRTEAIRDLGRGVPADVRRQLTSAFLTDWLENVVQAERRPATYANYSTVVRLHIRPGIGDIPLVQLAPQHIRELLAERLGAGLAPGYVRYIRKLLGIAMGHAVALELIRANPVTIVAGPQVPRTATLFFTPGDIKKVLSAVEDGPLSALVDVLLGTGMRVSEALGLSWDDVDLAERTFAIRHQLAWQDKAFVLAPPKTAAGVRTGPLPQFAVDALQAHQTRQRFAARNPAVHWDNALDLIFTTDSGTPWHRRNALRAFQDLLTAEGLPALALKDLRHANASLLHAQGASARDVMEQLGHSRIDVTLDVYTHLFQSRRRELADSLDAWRAGTA